MRIVKAMASLAPFAVLFAGMSVVSCGGASEAIKAASNSDGPIQTREAPLETASNPAAQIHAPEEPVNAASDSAAQARVKNVAVVETGVDMRTAELTPQEVRVITAELRKEAVKNLPRDRYNVMTSETVYAQSGAVLEECADENCVIVLGSKIGADYIARGTISKFQAKFTLSVEIYDTEDGHLAASSEVVRSENVEELLEKATGAFAAMYKTFSNLSASAPDARTPPVKSGGGASSFNDNRDGKTYSVAVIGGKTWMAENLNYTTPSGSWCYDDDNYNCDKYGRLYNWEAAAKACPAGWRLPSEYDWRKLVGTAGGSLLAGKKLKSTTGWYNHGNGADNYGFAALPGGYRYASETFYGIGSYGNWWTATASGMVTDAGHWKMSYKNENAEHGYLDKRNGQSVRCMLD